MEPIADRYLTARRTRLRHQIKPFKLSENYGPNTSLVLEALALVNETTLLRAIRLPSDQRFVSISDYEEAKRLAWDQEYPESCWSDMCGHEIAPIFGLTSQDNQWRPYLDCLNSDSDQFVRVVECALPIQFVDLTDNVYGDIFYAAKARVVVGTESWLHELLLAIYALGGWPCGWEGRYPKGRMIAYFPVNSQPKSENEQPINPVVVP